jgi:hypothetical protein
VRRETPALLGPLEKLTSIAGGLQVQGETPSLLGPLERVNLNHWRSSDAGGDTYSVGSVRES